MVSSLLSNRKLAAGQAKRVPARQLPESAAANQPPAKEEVDAATSEEAAEPAGDGATAPGVKDSAVKINIQNMTQKLPPGQSLITVNDGSKAIMQASAVLYGCTVYFVLWSKSHICFPQSPSDTGIRRYSVHSHTFVFHFQYNVIFYS